MTDPYILQAREVLAAECEKNGHSESAECYRDGIWDQCRDVTVLARVLREHAEKQPTFEQKVEAMRAALDWNDVWGGKADSATHALALYDRHLAEIMAPKVDPLVEAMSELGWCNPEALASDLRKALAARGITIPEIAQ